MLRRLWRRSGARTPTVMQMEATECGAASLAIILAFYGRWLTLDEVREQCAVSRDGSSARNIVKAARENGLIVSAQRMEPHHLHDAELPAIIHWGMNHFVVIEAIEDERVFINDPAEGPRTVDRAIFDRAFTGIVLLMKPGPDFAATGSAWSLRAALGERLRGLRGTVGYTILVSLSLVIPGLLVPVFSQVFIDQILVNQFASWLVPLLLGMLVCALPTGLLNWLQREVLLRLETHLATAGAIGFVEHLTRLPMAFFAQREAGQLTSRVGYNDRVAQIGASDLGQILLNLLTAGSFLLGMLFYAPSLAVLTAGMASLNALLVWAQARSMADNNRRLAVATAMHDGAIKQGLQMIESHKASGSEDLLRQRIVSMHARMLNLRQSLGMAQMRLGAVAPLITLACSVLVLALGSRMVIAGELTVGMLVAFQALMAAFFSPIVRLVQIGGRIRDGEAYLRALDDTLRHRVDAEFRSPAPIADLRKLEGAVAVEALSFRYGPTTPLLIDGISFTLAPGERLAIVGASGSGKSTLGRLIGGLQEPTAGWVAIDGTPLRQVPRPLLRRSLAVVDQHPFLFGDTVRNNITLWDDSMPEDRVARAAKLALIHDTILARRGGYAARIVEGGRDLSGGQRQRLEIARALALDPKILILDEATAALDPHTEAQFFANLRTVACTTIVIAHRYTAVRHCDHAIVLHEGKIVESGPPAQLMADGERFRALMGAS